MTFVTHEDALQRGLNHHRAGRLALECGQCDEAIAALRQALAIVGDQASILGDLGRAQHTAGRLDEAIAAYCRALTIGPGDARVASNLGVALQQTGRIEEAIAAYDRALALKGDEVAVLCNKAAALQAAGRYDEAIAACQSALAINPEHAEAHYNLGCSLRLKRALGPAIAALRRAIALDPGHAGACNNLGIALQSSGCGDEAIEAYSQAVAIVPDHADVLNNLGNALRDRGRIDEAMAVLERALTLSPENTAALGNLSRCFLETGRLEEGIAALRRLVALRPDQSYAWSGLLFPLHFDPSHDARSLLAEHRRWAQACAARVAGEMRPHANDRSAARRLRIGYVSPDFRAHAVGRMLLPLFTHHDRQRVEVVAYSDVRLADAHTVRLRELADEWHDNTGRSDAEVAAQVRRDRIDILVDLALHTSGNRMMVFARKPAPVQATMLGLPGTTGLSTIDYRLSDPYFDPPGANDAAYSECTVRLPHCFWCYQPASEAPPVGPLPAAQKGFVTFGCLNQFAKVSRPALELWIPILRGVPGSRLVLHVPEGSARNRLRALFQDAGIAPERIACDARVPYHDYFARYHDIDLALDPSPYCGGTTTMDALWMGVPVVTLAGRTAVGRGGVSILSNVGLPELIAGTPEEYAAIAMHWASDLPRLAALRAELRPRMLASPLTDGPGYAASVEAAFRLMWQRWCRT